MPQTIGGDMAEAAENPWGRGPESYQNQQFREATSLVNRILNMQDAPDLMSFGPSITDLDGALEEGFISSEKEFRPELRRASIDHVDLLLEGSGYSSVGFFFKQGGSQSADPDWLGNVNFRNPDETLTYTFHKDGRIDMRRQERDSKWVQTCVPREGELSDLVHSLTVVKELYARKGLGVITLNRAANLLDS